MKKYPMFFVSDTSQSAEISRAVKAGSVRKIGPRLYTSNMADEPTQLVRQNLWQIVSLLFPGAVVSNRSAIENKISPAGKLYITAESARTVRLPGLEVVVLKGKPPLLGWTVRCLIISLPAGNAPTLRICYLPNKREKNQRTWNRVNWKTG